MRVALIGLGARGTKYLDVIKSIPQLSLTAVCDSDQELVNAAQLNYGVPAYTKVESMIEEHKLDFAIVAVPHNCYFDIIKSLAEAGIHIIKEKPFAINLDEASKIDAILVKNNIHMLVAVQRRFNPFYSTFNGLLSKIGKLYRIDARYTFCLDRVDKGWRSNQTAAGGGVLLDMGYHMIDLLLWYFGQPENIALLSSTGNRYKQAYDVEDTAIFNFAYKNHNSDAQANMIGALTLSRLSYKEQEKFIVNGSDGTLVMRPTKITLYNRTGDILQNISCDSSSSRNPLRTMVEHFVSFLQGNEVSLISDYKEHFNHLKIIEQAYHSSVNTPIQSNKRKRTNTDNNSVMKDYIWPIISKSSKDAVMEQLNSGQISIYDRSGIFKIFEDNFANYHGRKYALVTNSGTSALHSAYEALQLSPGDEIIVPAYTFFATVSPLMQYGVKLVYCDCKSDGNIDPKEIARKISDKTKAIVITHMWGMPCDMDEIMTIVQRYKLPLVEDCSHAHGALYKGKLVGTFGAVAIWSLQGQKIVTGGEGGILLTDDTEIYYRAQLLGQYNKRCVNEIDKGHSLYKFSLTGMGLKLRAHPIAIALANEQFTHLDEWLKQKRSYSEQFLEKLSHVPFLTMPNIIEDKLPAWYAFVMQYDETAAGISINDFVAKLKEKGLTEIERPLSTCPIYDLPLFKETDEIMPRRYNHMSVNNSTYPFADKFYRHALKLPVWALPEHQPIVDKYINVILQVASELYSSPMMQKGISLTV